MALTIPQLRAHLERVLRQFLLRLASDSAQKNPRVEMPVKRYYLTPIIGSGTMADPYRAQIQAPGNVVSVIPSNPDGTPSSPWCVCLVDAVDHAPFLTNPALRALPDMPRESRISSVSQEERDALDATLTRFGIVLTVRQTDTFGEVLRAVGRRLDPTFDENRLQVG